MGAHTHTHIRVLPFVPRPSFFYSASPSLPPRNSTTVVAGEGYRYRIRSLLIHREHFTDGGRGHQGCIRVVNSRSLGMARADPQAALRQVQQNTMDLRAADSVSYPGPGNAIYMQAHPRRARQVRPRATAHANSYQSTDPFVPIKMCYRTFKEQDPSDAAPCETPPSNL